MILSGQTIRRYCDGDAPLIAPFSERKELAYTDFRNVEGRQVPHQLKMTYGVGPAGYDVRVEFDEHGEKPSIMVPPGGFVLASTIERFQMPVHVIGMVADKSSWARRGIAVQHTVIEPGWAGWLTLEISNHSAAAIRIERGMPIAQIIFHVIDEAVDFPYDAAGKYQNQGRGPREAK